MGSCNICFAPSTLCCSKCREVFYCDKTHQQLDWKAHKKLCCAKYAIARSPELGRYMIAKTDIKAGEIILKEIPLVFGPKTASYPICLGCDRLLTVRPMIRCSKCGWPICGADCRYLERRHRKECQLMSSKGYFNASVSLNSTRIESSYCCITPLRCLLLDEPRLKRFFTLQSNLDALESSSLYEVHKRSLVPFVRDVLKLDYDQRTVLRTVAVLDTNCFEVKRPSDRVKIRAVYATASMLSHDCRPNTKHAIDGDEYELRLIAVEDIPKGGIITVTYTQTLWSTRNRRDHLWMSKQFWCRCDRCRDATEFGTYIGSYLCSDGCGSYVISIDPLDADSDWKCVGGCAKIYSARSVKRSDEYWKRRIESTTRDDNVRRNLKKFLTDVKDNNRKAVDDPLPDGLLILHENNSYVVEARYALLQLQSKTLSGLRSNEVAAVIDDYQKLINIANVLEPGNSSFREQLLMYMEMLHGMTA